jgi:hypothetical protein
MIVERRKCVHAGLEVCAPVCGGCVCGRGLTRANAVPDAALAFLLAIARAVSLALSIETAETCSELIDSRLPSSAPLCLLGGLSSSCSRQGIWFCLVITMATAHVNLR